MPNRLLATNATHVFLLFLWKSFHLESNEVIKLILMAEINTSANNSGKKSFSKSINRRSTRVDLTPMVDLGFLLITFFVFTTAMSTPRVMNLDEPKDSTTKDVPLSGAMTIILGKNHQLYFYYGMLEKQTINGQIHITNFKGIRDLILSKSKATDLGKLMYVIKADKNATFGDAVNLLDEMSICNIPQGHYAEVELTTTEEDFITHMKN